MGAIQDYTNLRAERSLSSSDVPNRLPLEELLDVAVQGCSGLEAAHAKGIIHRDIKPASIFLTSSGQVKIVDFGLAKAVVSEQQGFDDDVVPIADWGMPSEQSRAPDAGVVAPGLAHQPPTNPLGKTPDKADTTLTRFGNALGTPSPSHRPILQVITSRILSRSAPAKSP